MWIENKAAEFADVDRNKGAEFADIDRNTNGQEKARCICHKLSQDDSY